MPLANFSKLSKKFNLNPAVKMVNVLGSKISNSPVFLPEKILAYMPYLMIKVLTIN